MAQSLKILGQSAPAATTEVDLYSVPGGTTAAVSSVVVCNRGGTATTFRVSIAAGGGGTGSKDYLYYDTALPANDTFVATLGITIAGGDKIRIYAGNGNLSFSAFGAENS